MCVKGKENGGPAKCTVQRQNSQEVREYMDQQILERRRRKQQMRRNVEFEQERKRRCIQAVVIKQKEALHRTRKRQTQQNGVGIEMCLELVPCSLLNTCYSNYFQHSSPFSSAA